MINSISGIITQVDERNIMLSIGPLEISIAAPQAALLQIGTSVKLHTHLYWHQENGPQLFGFKTIFERELFLSLISCSGIGPKLSVTILDCLPPSDLLRAVQADDTQSISKVPGIGKKKAEQLIVHLRHALDKLLEHHQMPVTEAGVDLIDWKTLSEVLESLQYGRTEVTQALNHVKKIAAQEQTPAFDSLLRKALQFLSHRP